MILQQRKTPGENYGLMGMDISEMLPGLSFRVDCILQDTEREAYERFSLLEELISRRGFQLPRNLMIPPKYLEGNTLQNKKKPKGSVKNNMKRNENNNK
jgi:hypothetical protein